MNWYLELDAVVTGRADADVPTWGTVAQVRGATHAMALLVGGNMMKAKNKGVLMTTMLLALLALWSTTALPPVGAGEVMDGSPDPPALFLCVVAGAGVEVGTPFTFAVGIGRRPDGPGSITVRAAAMQTLNQCERLSLGLVESVVFIRETVPAGIEVTSIDAGAEIFSPPDLSAGTIAVRGRTFIITFTNRRCSGVDATSRCPGNGPPPPRREDIVDTVPPTIEVTVQPEPNASGWNNTDVIFRVSATDQAPPGGVPSGVKNVDVAEDGMTLPCRAWPFCTVKETVEGVHEVQFLAEDGEGNVRSGGFSVRLDKTVPTVSCGPRPTFRPHQAGATVTATVADARSGPVATTVSAAVSTERAGSFAAPLTGSDHAGNTATVSCPYQVGGYDFVGFLPPVKSGELNRANAGRTIPLKWRLKDASGADITELAAVVSLHSGVIPCTGGAVSMVEPVRSSDGAGLRYDATAKHYVYPWKTEKAWAGSCRRVLLRLADGSEQTADFHFK